MSGRRSGSNDRNGHRARTLDPRLGPLQLRSPKLRQGSYFPPFLARKTRSKRWSPSSRRPESAVDDLVQAMGLTGISKLALGRARADPGERLNKEPKRRADVVGLSGSLARFAPQRGLDRPPGRRRAAAAADTMRLPPKAA
jgi:Transposase, Mutator family